MKTTTRNQLTAACLLAGAAALVIVGVWAALPLYGLAASIKWAW